MSKMISRRVVPMGTSIRPVFSMEPVRENVLVPGLPVVLINDGRLMERALKAQGLDQRWLEQRLTEHGVRSPSEVFLLSVDEAGNVCFVAREAV